MFGKYMKKTVMAAAVAAAVLLCGPARAEEFTRDQINEMIHDYIMKNPQVILDAVDAFQKKNISDRQTEALERNHDEIFKNETSPFLGNPKGDVTIVEFFDYNCHYCKEVFFTLRKLAEEDKNLKVIFKDFPILGPTSNTAAKWALAAHRQKKYFEFHQKMMEHRGPLKNEDIEKAATDIGLDMAAARSYVDGTDSMMQLERNRALAAQMSFNGTPSFIINDESFSGVPDADDLRRKIAEKRKGGVEKGGEKKE